jgi:hypothetical protein
MRQRSRAERKAMFSRMKGDGLFDHLNGEIKVKQIKKEIELPVLFNKKNNFAEVNSEAAYMASLVGPGGPSAAAYVYDAYDKHVLDMDVTNNKPDA